jgi:hypothetical protein
MLWAFDIPPALDGQGWPLDHEQEKRTQGFMCQPEEFPITLTPRSGATGRMVIDK